MFCSQFDTNLNLVPWTMPNGYIFRTNLWLIVAGFLKTFTVTID